MNFLFSVICVLGLAILAGAFLKRAFVNRRREIDNLSDEEFDNLSEYALDPVQRPTDLGPVRTPESSDEESPVCKEFTRVIRAENTLWVNLGKVEKTILMTTYSDGVYYKTQNGTWVHNSGGKLWVVDANVVKKKLLEAGRNKEYQEKFDE